MSCDGRHSSNYLSVMPKSRVYYIINYELSEFGDIAHRTAARNKNFGLIY